ncbi:hypothetical protein MHH67_11425 [Bacillus sp. FSL K6-0047]
MSNKDTTTRIYPVSQIGRVLKIAREGSCQEEQRTKRNLAETLGITARRLTAIEEGEAPCSLDLAIEWCRAVKDYTALSKILHMFDLGLPATNPLLLEDPLQQILNFRRQAKQAIDAITELMDLSVRMRPDDVMAERFPTDFYKCAEEILDMKQASEALLTSMSINWGLDREKLRRSWTQEALVDGVLVNSVTHYEEIKREKFFSERTVSL